MKRLLFLVLGLSIFAACKEKGPLIDFTPKGNETSFMAAPETPQQRIVLIEEFTGVTCPTCPPGHAALKRLEDAYKGKLAIIGIQLIGNAQTRPYDHDGIKTQNDNRSQKGTDLANGIYGSISGIPVAGFDRVIQNGILLPTRNAWDAYMLNRVDVPTRANVRITSSYNESTRMAEIKVRVAYTADVPGNQALTVALVENDVVDAQELPLGDTAKVAANYVHKHVLRDILTSPTGTGILGDKTIKLAGQVYERTFVYELPANVLKPDNCHIVAFVSNNSGSDSEVLQAAEAHLK